MLSQANSGRCWAGGLLARMDTGRGGVASEPCSEWTGTAVRHCTHSFRAHLGRADKSDSTPRGHVQS
eukprot:2675781-Pyramimonas_sp.AAC.1